MPRVKSNMRLSQDSSPLSWSCSIHNLEIKNTCAFPSCHSPFLCFICHKTHESSHLPHTYSTPQGKPEVNPESLYESLGLHLKNNCFPLKDVFEKVKEHMQLVWQKLQETVQKKLNQQLKDSPLWKCRLKLEESRQEHLENQDNQSLTNFISNLDEFVQKWILKDSRDAKEEAQKLNQIFSNFAMKTESIGNQLCSLMQKSLSDFSKEIKFENVSSLLSRLKTDQLEITTTNEFSLSKQNRFFTETFDPSSFQKMLEMIHPKAQDNYDQTGFGEHFNSRFSTFSKHTMIKSNLDQTSIKQNDPKIRYKQNKNPFTKNSPSERSRSNKTGEIRHSLPATGQWEGHGKPVYYTNSVQNKFGNPRKNKKRSSDAFREHKSENISLIEGSNSKAYKKNRKTTSELNTSFSER